MDLQNRINFTFQVYSNEKTISHDLTQIIAMPDTE